MQRRRLRRWWPRPRVDATLRSAHVTAQPSAAVGRTLDRHQTEVPSRRSRTSDRLPRPCRTISHACQPHARRDPPARELQKGMQAGGRDFERATELQAVATNTFRLPKLRLGDPWRSASIVRPRHGSPSLTWDHRSIRLNDGLEFRGTPQFHWVARHPRDHELL